MSRIHRCINYSRLTAFFIWSPVNGREEKQEELSAEQIWEEEANKSAEDRIEASPDNSEETVVAEEPQEEEPKEEVEAKLKPEEENRL